jgi:arginyl-tRNA--protein-N-Asp/Glu arginylyltransferase
MKIINTSLHLESLSPEEFDGYLSQGWYRMYQHVFTVSHLLNYETFEVDRVWWLRYSIEDIQSHRSHRKIRNRNIGFEVKIEKFSSITTEDEELYKLYFESIDFEGYENLSTCLFDNKEDIGLFNTWSISLYDKGKLFAKALIDLGEKAVLAKVNFYDPAYAAYSPSKYLILKTIDFMREQGYEYYYPGYLVVNRPKFLYKLFLGKESAQYYHPDTETWKPYCDSILLPEVRTEEEEDLLKDVYFSFFR